MIRQTKYFLPAICASLLSNAAALAQKPSEIPPPAPPFVARVPQNGTWEIVSEFPESTPPATSGPIPEKSVKFTKFGEITRQEITFLNGDTTEKWLAGVMYLWKPKGQDAIITDASTADGYDSAQNRNFPGVGWVSLSSFEGITNFEKQTCYHYKNSDREAWISCANNLPVAFTDRGVLKRYTFLPPPSQPLTLPPNFQSAWDAAMKIITRRNQLQKELFP